MFDDLVSFDMPFHTNPIITVIGVGGGGCNAVNRMYLEGIRDVDFIVANTDVQALDASPVKHRIQLGATLTEGRGAGKRSDIGEQAAIESIQEFIDLLEGQTKMVFLVAGMGKGTGTGAAPVIARACHDLNILTVGVVTLPFTIEGPSRQLQALQGVSRLREEVDALLIIHNEKLRGMYGNLSLGDAFKKADDILMLAVKGIAEIITVHGYINVDFADVISVMTKGGIAFMGSATASGPDRARKVIDDTINSPLLYSNDIRGASRVLLNITSGRDEITVDEVGIISDTIMARVGGSVNVIWGTCTDDTLTDEIRITLVATGFRDDMIPDWLSLTPPKREVVNLGPHRQPVTEPRVERPVVQPREIIDIREQRVHDAFVPNDPPIEIVETAAGEPAWEPFPPMDAVAEPGPEPVREAPPAMQPDPAPRIAQPLPPNPAPPRHDPPQAPPPHPHYPVPPSAWPRQSWHEPPVQDRPYGFQAAPVREEQARAPRIRDINYHNLSNPDILDEVERIPAYKRKKLPVQEEMFFEEGRQSRYTMGADARLRQNNSFLFDVVD